MAVRLQAVSSLARANAVTVQCAATCAPFASSPGTYATCCKQHAVNKAVPKPPAGFRTATVTPVTPFQKKNPLPVVKSKAPKPASTTALQNAQVKKASGTVLGTFKSSLDALKKSWNGNNTNSTQPASTTTAPTTAIPSGGGGSFASVIGKNMNKVHLPNEPHKPKGYREEGKLDQPGDNFRFDYVVAIPTTRKKCGEEVTVEFDGGVHSKDSSGKDLDRTGDRLSFPICTGSVRYARQYDEAGDHKYDYRNIGDAGITGTNVVLQKGSTYGITVTNSLSSNGRLMEGYVQNLSTGGPLQKVISVPDTGHFKKGILRYQPGWRIGPRIDGKNDANEPLYSKGMTLS